MSRSRRHTKLRNDDEEHGSASSTKFTETATGWHVLKGESYCQSGLCVARRLKSCPFVVGRHTWCIAYFPDGVTEDTADCISSAQRLEDRCAGTGREAVMVRTTFSLLDVAGGPTPSLTVSCGVWTLSKIGQSCCHARFIERKEFESSYVKDDEFCIIKVRRDSTVARCAAAAGPTPAIR
jgi:speckle-type POZ protein